jgi:F0F1-type ATP synthase alpha subunit
VIQITVLRIGGSCKALSVEAMDVSTPKLQEYFRKNLFSSLNSNISDRANEEVKETQKVNDLHDGNK